MPIDPISYYVDNSATVDSLNLANNTPVKGGDGASAAADLNFETFLKLLVTELENQDPLDPLDNKEMTAQIASFSSLEQNIQQNKYLETIAGQSDYSQQTIALSYVGKDALIPGDLTATNGVANVSLNYQVPSVASDVSIEVLNEDGDVIRTLEGEVAVGRNETTWDSKDEDGNAVPAGFYTFRVSGTAPNGDEVKVKEFTFGHVASLEGDGDAVEFTSSDGRTFSLDDILLVREAAVVPQADYSQQAIAVSYIGKDVLIPGGAISSNGSSNVSLNYGNAEEFDSVSIEVLDANGDLVRTLVGDTGTGRQETVWDNKDENGNDVAAGEYSFVVKGTTASGEEQDVVEFSYAHVEALESAGSTLVFRASDGRTFGFADVILVKDAA